MDTQFLLEAARDGRVDVIRGYMENNSQFFAQFFAESPTQHLLHEAIKHHQVVMVDLLLKEYPESACLADENGYHPLDIAVKMGNFGIFQQILGADKQLCERKGLGGSTALHHSAEMGRLDMIAELLDASPELINAVDDKGKTALDTAVSCRQYEVCRVLLERAKRPMMSADWMEYFKFKKGRDSPSETRNSLLMVASLVATMCFTAIFTAFAFGDSNSLPSKNSWGWNDLVPFVSYEFFLVVNTLGFRSSITIILQLTAGYPFRTELITALLSLAFSYAYGALHTSLKHGWELSLGLGGLLLATLFCLPNGAKLFRVIAKYWWKTEG